MKLFFNVRSSQVFHPGIARWTSLLSIKIFTFAIGSVAPIYLHKITDGQWFCIGQCPGRSSAV